LEWDTVITLQKWTECWSTRHHIS